MDKYAFILGMITAFCECVAAGCKDLALSPPLTAADYEAVHAQAEELIEKHGLVCLHEKNEDMHAENRFEWIVIAREQNTIKEYQALRSAGYSPAASLQPFVKLLSYQPDKAIHTGYDAYRELFPL